MSAIQIKKATRKTVKLKLAVQGPSGSGKTFGALELAKRLGEKVLVIDTENQSASLYADKFDFDVIDLTAPYTSERYKEAIKASVAGGYEVLVIDGITPQWDGIGGILRRKEELDQRPGSNSYTNWAKFTPEHTDFIETIKQAPLHIIATMRSKTEYVLETNDKGKSQPRKLGLAPIQREGADYEFSIVFDVQLDHRAIATKDRTGLFSDRVINLADPKTAEELIAWMNSGVAADPIQAITELTGTVLEQKVDTQRYWWKVQNGHLCAVYYFADDVSRNTQLCDYSRLLDQEGKQVTLKVYDRGERDGKRLYELADVVKVEPVPELLPTTQVATPIATIVEPVPQKINPICNIDANMLICKPNDVTTERDVKGKRKYVSVHYSIPRMRENDPDKVRQYDKFMASIWDDKLDEAAMGAIGKECIFRFTKSKDGKYTNIVDIVSIAGVPHKDGKPVTQ